MRPRVRPEVTSVVVCLVFAGILDPQSPVSISTRHLALDARSPQLCPKPDQGDAVSSTARQALFKYYSVTAGILDPQSPFSTSSSRAYLTRDLLCPFQLVTSHLMRGLLNFAQSQIKEMPCQARQDRLCFNSMFVLAGGDPRSPVSISTRHLALDARSPQLCPKPDQGDAVSSTARQALF